MCIQSSYLQRADLLIKERNLAGPLSLFPSCLEHRHDVQIYSSLLPSQDNKQEDISQQVKVAEKEEPDVFAE